MKITIEGSLTELKQFLGTLEDAGHPVSPIVTMLETVELDAPEVKLPFKVALLKGQPKTSVLLDLKP